MGQTMLLPSPGLRIRPQSNDSVRPGGRRPCIGRCKWLRVHAGEDAQPSKPQQQQQQQQQNSGISGRRLLLLAGASAVTSAVPLWWSMARDRGRAGAATLRNEQGTTSQHQSGRRSYLTTSSLTPIHSNADSSSSSSVGADPWQQQDGSGSTFLADIDPGQATAGLAHSGDWLPWAAAAVGGLAGGTAAWTQIEKTKSLQTDLREAEASLSAANSRLSALGQALGTPSSAELQVALESRLAELSDASTELRETRRRLQSEQQRLAEADKAGAQAARKQEDLQRALQASQQSVSRLEAESQATQQALAAAQADAQEAHADAAQKQQALTETRKLLAEARDRLQQREGELTELQTALQDAVTDADAAKAKVTAERENSRTLDRARAAAVEAVRDLLSTKRQLEGEVAAGKQEAAELGAQLQEERGARAALEQTAEAFAANSEELEVAVREAEAREQATLRELHAEAAGRNEALLALEGLTRESGARQERLREAMQACQHLQSELEAAQAEAAGYKAQLGGREQEVRELEGDIGQAVADVRDALHREVAALAQAEDERAAAEEAIQRMAEAEDALESALQDASRLRGRLSTAGTSLKELEGGLKVELAGTQKALAAREAELREAAPAAQQLPGAQAEARRLQAQVDDLRQQLKEARSYSGADSAMPSSLRSSSGTVQPGPSSGGGSSVPKSSSPHSRGQQTAQQKRRQQPPQAADAAAAANGATGSGPRQPPPSLQTRPVRAASPVDSNDTKPPPLQQSSAASNAAPATPTALPQSDSASAGEGSLSSSSSSSSPNGSASINGSSASAAMPVAVRADSAHEKGL